VFKVAPKEQLVVPANIDYLGDLRDFVILVGKKYHYPDKLINAFKLAVDEAATNIIKHASEDDDNLITIEAIVKRASLTIRLIDQGTFFDPNWVKDPNIKKHIEIGQKASLGILLMRRLMDKIDYRRTDAGNELRLTKFYKPESANGALSRLRRRSQRHAPMTFQHAALGFVLLAAVVLASLGYFYTRVDDQIVERYLLSGETITKQVASQISAVKPEVLNSPEGVNYFNAIILPVYDEHLGDVYSMAVEDTAGIVAWSTLTGERAKLFKRPDTTREVKPAVFAYTVPGNLSVYEFEASIHNGRPNGRYARIHVLLLQDVVAAEISERRVAYLERALVIFTISYLLLFIFSYIITNPMRKLTDWVNELKSGNPLNEMDIDASSDIGEIAQAFSEITEKFHETQKSLASHESIHKEISIAKDIQRSLLPQEIPELAHYAIATHYEAAQSVGGDYYDVIQVDQDSFGIVIADVSGKGVPGSMIMTMIRTALRTEARGVIDAADVLAKVNEFIVNDIKYGMFITVFYVILNTRLHTLNFASAGHTPMILHRAASNKSYYLNPVGYPIGIQLPDRALFAKHIQSDTIQLMAGDTLMLYTDGITEAMNPRKKLFGEQRLIETIGKFSGLELTDFSEHFKAELDAFTGGLPQQDDITYVTIRHTGDVDQADEIPPDLAIENKYLNTEELAVLLKVVEDYPVFNAEEIARKLNTAKYKHFEIGVDKLEAELLRRRLHTIQLRQDYAHISRKKRQRTENGRSKHARNDEKRSSTNAKSGKSRSGRKGRKRKSKVIRITKPSLRSLLSGTSNREKHDSDYINTISPELESDFVLGDFLEYLSKVESSLEDRLVDDVDFFSPTAPVSEDPPSEPRVAAADLADAFADEDISDSLIDTLLDKHEELLAAIAPATVESASDLLGDSASPSQDAADARLDNPDVTEKTPAEETSGLCEDDAAEDESAEAASAPADGGTGFIIESDALTTQPESDVHGDASRAETPSTDVPSRSADAEEPLPETREAELAEDAASEKLAAAIQEHADVAADVEAQAEPLEADVVEDESPEDVHAQPEPTTAEEDTQVPSGSQEREAPQSEHAATPAAGMPPVSRPVESVVSDFHRCLMQGTTAYKEKAYPQAITAFLRLIQIDSEFKEGYELLGNAYFRNNQLKEALAAYEKAMDKFEPSAVLLENLALIYAKMGVFSLAVRTLEKALVLYPGRKHLVAKVERLKQLRSPKEAALDKTVMGGQRQQVSPQALLYRDGIEHYHRKRFTEAIQSFEILLESYPEVEEIQKLLAVLYFKCNRFDEALRLYSQLRKLRPPDVSIRENVALIYARQGKYDQAIQEWQALLDEHPQRTDLKRKIHTISQLA